MNSIGVIGASKVIASAASIALWVGDALEPIAEWPIADLIVILQEVDEGGGSERAARLAAEFAAPKGSRFTLVDEA